MKIHIHISNLKPGGAQKVMINLANHWVKQGHQISLSANSVSGFWAGTIDPDIDVVDLKVANFLAAVPSLRKTLAQRGPDVILSAMTQANFTATMVGKLTGIPCVLSERHHTSTWMARLSPTKRFVYKALLPFLYSRADARIAQTAAAAQDLAEVAKLPTNAVDVIPNPISQPSELPERAPHPWLNKTETPVVVGIGRLVPQKDFATLIRAIALLRERKAVRLLLLGDGPLLPDLTQLARSEGVENAVFFAGQVDNVQDCLARAKVYVLSSHFEGFPNAMLEALAMGVPVVSTDCPTGPRDILQDEKYGKLVPVGDPIAMAHAIEQAIDHPHSPGMLRERAAEFDLGLISNRYLDVLRRVAGRMD